MNYIPIGVHCNGSSLMKVSLPLSLSFEIGWCEFEKPNPYTPSLKLLNVALALFEHYTVQRLVPECPISYKNECLMSALLVVPV